MPRNNYPRRPARPRTRGERRDLTDRIIDSRRRRLRRHIEQSGEYQPSFYGPVSARYPLPDITPAGNVRRVTLADYDMVDRYRIETDRVIGRLLMRHMWLLTRQVDRRGPKITHRCHCSWCTRRHEPFRGAARHRWRADIAREIADMHASSQSDGHATHGP